MLRQPLPCHRVDHAVTRRAAVGPAEVSLARRAQGSTRRMVYSTHHGALTRTHPQEASRSTPIQCAGALSRRARERGSGKQRSSVAAGVVSRGTWIVFHSDANALCRPPGSSAASQSALRSSHRGFPRPRVALKRQSYPVPDRTDRGGPRLCVDDPYAHVRRAYSVRDSLP